MELASAFRDHKFGYTQVLSYVKEFHPTSRHWSAK
jgi:hypothetical protein